MELKTTKIYVPNEDFEQSLTTEAISDVVTICNLNDSKTAKELLSSQFLILNNLDYKEQSLYAFTKEELERVIRFVYNSAIDYENQSMGSFLNDDVPNLNTLINQILK